MSRNLPVSRKFDRSHSLSPSRSVLHSVLGMGLASGLTALAARSGRNASPSSGLKTKVWWSQQRKPEYMPPNKAFAVAWPILWGLSSWSFLRVWRSPASPERRQAIGAYLAHAGLNVLWSPLFFRRHQQKAALAVVVGDLAASSAYVNSARKVDGLAGLAASPLVAWLGFASLLNFELIRRNR